MAEISAFKINGVIDTSKSVLSNIDVLCRASGCWLTYDSTTALWSVIINRAGSSVKSFTDANIIGSINITGSGIDSMYNSVEVTYPNQDLLNNRDSVNFVVPDAKRFPNELDKKLTISLDCINNEIQAAYIGAIELNQNRIDKIIQFKTDYSVLGLKAGDLIDVTSTMYGYTRKVLRITKIAEEDADDGTIQLSITALEYDETVYSTAGLIYNARTTATGVVPKSANTALNALDKASQSNIVYTFQTSFFNIPGISPSSTYSTFFNPSTLTLIDLAKSTKVPYTGTYRISYLVNWGSDFEKVNNEPINLPNSIRKWTVVIIYKNGVLYEGDLGDGQSTTIIKGDDLNADANVSGIFTANKGDTIGFYLYARSDLEAVANNLPVSQVAVTGTLQLLSA